MRRAGSTPAQRIFVFNGDDPIDQNERPCGQPQGLCAAGGEGFEPPHTVPETAVLPLDEPPKLPVHSTIKGKFASNFSGVLLGILFSMC